MFIIKITFLINLFRFVNCNKNYFFIINYKITVEVRRIIFKINNNFILFYLIIY
jgi:hypothetical protein